MLEIENKLTEMKVFDRFIKGLDIDQERISELKIGQQKFPKLKCKENKRMGVKKDQNIQELWEIFKKKS